MKFDLLSRDECQRITQESEAFYCKTITIEGQIVEIYDYRLASLSDFVDNKAFELRGLTFVLDRETYKWKRNLLLNKFFNVNQCSTDDEIELEIDGNVILVGENHTFTLKNGGIKKAKDLTAVDDIISW